MAALLSSQQSPQDLLGQIDEQKFALLMANTDLDAAMQRADAIRCGINDLSGVFTSSGNRLGISGGLTQLALADQGPQDLLHRAEKALTLAQGNGQNQIAKLLDNAPLPAGDYPERRNRA